ncbi:MAG: TIGR03936 family radical SAM-associated protein [Clostridia bacterium]|nr:TIGR03936 family radical SAM-associated protein [Clostridia bacterium]
MKSIRMKFIRGEEVKFISHLDLMKTFERALRRSGLPIAYSQGFNPHPQMVFGLPLSVGVTSEAEYADFDLSTPVDTGEFIERLNGSLPNGLKILNVKEKNVKDNIMASISMARYVILVSPELGWDAETLQGRIKNLLESKEIIVKKEGKKGARDIDIRPMIHSIEVGKLNTEAMTGSENQVNIQDSTKSWLNDYIEKIYKGFTKPSYNQDNIFCLNVLLSAGSAANLKPELLVSALESYLDERLKIVKIHRTELFVDRKGNIAEPLDDKVINSQ